MDHLGTLQPAWDDPVLLAVAAILVLSMVAFLTLLLQSTGTHGDRSPTSSPENAYATQVRALARKRLDARRHSSPMQRSPEQP
jgi:hypothetical protein